MATIPAENRNGRILQGRWGNTTRQSIIELNVRNYGLVEELAKRSVNPWLRGTVRNGISTAQDPDNEFTYDLWNEAGDTLLAATLTPEIRWPEFDMLAAPDDVPAGERSWCLYYSDGTNYHIVFPFSQRLDPGDCASTELVILASM